MTEDEILDRIVLVDTPRNRDIARKHPAWKSFCEEMETRQYGEGPTCQAWAFYSKGWNARNRTMP